MEKRPMFKRFTAWLREEIECILTSDTFLYGIVTIGIILYFVGALALYLWLDKMLPT